MEYVITIDAGTTNFKVMLYDTKGKVCFSSIRHYWPEFQKNQKVRQSVESWKNALFGTMREISGYLDEKGILPEAVVVASQRASVIPFDSSGTPLCRAFMWQDKTTVAQCDKLSAEIPVRDAYLKTGLRIDPYFSAPKIIWFRENEPDIYRKSAKFAGVQDYIIYLLTGNFVTDHTQASRTLLFDITERKWSEEMLAAAGVSASLLPDLVPPGSRAGSICKSFSEAAGLREGTPVLIAGGDQQAAAIGLGVFKKGTAEANTGTGSFILSHSDFPVFDKEMRILCSISSAPDSWVAEAGILTSGIIYKWFARVIAGGSHPGAGEAAGKTDKGERTKGFPAATEENIEEAEIDEINRLAGSSEPGAGGIIILPHFKGCAAPYWDPYARGVIFNLTLSNTKADIARAVLEAIALELSDNLKIIEENTSAIEKVSVAGGLTRLDLFNMIQADAFSRAVVRYPDPEATSTGSLILACSSLGIYESIEEGFEKIAAGNSREFMPDAEKGEIYRNYSVLRKKLYTAISGSSLYTDFYSFQKEQEKKEKKRMTRLSTGCG